MSYDNKIDARVNISKWIFCLWIFPYCWQEQEQKAEEAELCGPEKSEEEALKEAKEAEEQPRVEEPKEEVEERHEDVFGGLDARLKALEEKFEQLLKVEEPEHKEIGISGYGSSEVDNMEVDTRKDDMIKKLGGYAK